MTANWSENRTISEIIIKIQDELPNALHFSVILSDGRVYSAYDSKEIPRIISILDAQAGSMRDLLTANN